jgi:hypothetical protein
MMFLLIVTVVSMLLAAIMSLIAWRISGEERRRSEARIAALAAEIHAAPEARPTLWDPPLRRVEPTAPALQSLFVAPKRRSGPRPFAILAGGGLVFATAVAIAVVSSRADRAPVAAVAAPAAVTTPASFPLELVALGHERVGDQLTVRGVIRNPASAAEMDRLTAVVFLFTPSGGFLATGRAAVETTALRPGDESTFVVTVPRAADVARYRVSFRTDDRVVPHLDRRHES